MAIAKVREDNGMPFKTYERGWTVGRQEVTRLLIEFLSIPLVSKVPLSSFPNEISRLCQCESMIMQLL